MKQPENHMSLIDTIINRLEKKYPDARIALTYSNPLELLVATILSAQSTDVMVNRITPRLFARYRSDRDYMNADVSELEDIIKSSGFYHNKARSIIGATAMIASKYSGEVPNTMQELVLLPGVARKTANVVLCNAFNKNEGIAVDTHVKRLSGLLGLSRYQNPEKIEKDLMATVPRDYWGRITYLLIEHGRQICIARRPKCRSCVLSDVCPSAKPDPGTRQASG